MDEGKKESADEIAAKLQTLEQQNSALRSVVLILSRAMIEGGAKREKIIASLRGYAKTSEAHGQLQEAEYLDDLADVLDNDGHR